MGTRGTGLPAADSGKPLWGGGKVEEIGDVQQSEHESDEAGHGQALLVMTKSRMRKLQDSPLCLEFAAALREDIAYPVRLGSVGERDNEFVATPEDEDWRAVEAVGFTARMQHHAHARQALRQGTKNRIGDV